MPQNLRNRLFAGEVTILAQTDPPSPPSFSASFDTDGATLPIVDHNSSGFSPRLQGSEDGQTWKALAPETGGSGTEAAPSRYRNVWPLARFVLNREGTERTIFVAVSGVDV